MAYIKKQEAEKIFVDNLIKNGGIESFAEMDEGRNTYYEFRLKNGTKRYWRNMSDENLEILLGGKK